MARKRRLGEVLVAAGVITEEQLEAALEAQETIGGQRRRLGIVITSLGFATEAELATALAQQLELPFVDLTTISPEPALVQRVPKRLAEHHHLIAVDEGPGGELVVAMADPTNVVAIDDVRVKTGAGRIRTVVATASAVGDAIERWYGLTAEATDAALRLNVEVADVEVLSFQPADEDEETVRRATEMAPIVRLVNALISDAVKSRATDVHIEPQPTEVQVRFRIDGLLREVMTLPKYVNLPVVSRIKIMGGMDIAERRRPQDGRGKIRVSGLEVDIRVSTIPTLTGEKTVIRLLRKEESQAGFDQLGMGPGEVATMERLLSMPQGLIVFTGPTGSGKTTSLYAAIRQLADPTRNIVTLEDPIEYQIRGVNQVQIDERTGITFARGLRSILRQDPNVILVGEIRDGETAQIALQAALTGHLVLTTLHTNDAVSAVTRLVDIGVEPFLIASALSAVVAQRLVRIVCSECRERGEPSERTLAMLGLTRSDLAEHRIVQGAGCEVCGYTGFRGRTGMYEILSMSRQIREQVAAQASEATLAQMARGEGMLTLRAGGMTLAFEGTTTLDEVLRATFFERQDVHRCPGCRQEVERTFAVCPFCQTSLGEQQCGRCGRASRPEWSVCPYCSAPTGHGVPVQDRIPRVLVVDDDRGLATMLTQLLAPDYRVEAAQTVADGMRRATHERPDAILLDHLLPDGTGIELARRLREHVATARIPTIMLTAAGDQAAEAEALDAGVDDFLRKPIEADVLRARIAAVLRRAVRAAG